MPTILQLSDKGGESGQALLVARIEAPDDVGIDAIYSRFVALAAEAGLQDTLDSFDDLVKAKRAAIAGLGATVPPVPIEPQAWGNPPVQPFQPVQTSTATYNPPQLPAAAQAAPAGQPPSCYHGLKEHISGITKQGPNKGKPWAAWACPADREDPSKCEKEWIR